MSTHLDRRQSSVGSAVSCRWLRNDRFCSFVRRLSAGGSPCRPILPPGEAEGRSQHSSSSEVSRQRSCEREGANSCRHDIGFNFALSLMLIGSQEPGIV